MLSPELRDLLDALAALAAHDKTAGLIIEDEYGCHWDLARVHTVGLRTDDPGMVLRLTRSVDST